MADRITIRHLTPAFHHFVGELGGTTTEAARRAGQDIGGTYRLERLFQGRYRVIRYAANGRGEHTPFGLTGHPARAMYDMLTFATDALREARRIEAQRIQSIYHQVITDNPNMR